MNDDEYPVVRVDVWLCIC